MMDDNDLARIAVMIQASERRLTSLIVGGFVALVFAMMFVTNRLDWSGILTAGIWIGIVLAGLAVIFGAVALLFRVPLVFRLFANSALGSARAGLWIGGVGSLILMSFFEMTRSIPPHDPTSEGLSMLFMAVVCAVIGAGLELAWRRARRP